MAKTPAPKPSKLIYQVQIKPELGFFDLVRNAAAQLSGYPDWETDGLSVVLKDTAKRRSLALRHNAVTYDQDTDDPTDEETGIKQVEEALTYLKIKSAVRFGFRRFYLASVNGTYDELVALTNLKLLSQDEKLLSLLPPKIEDLFYRIDGSDDKNQYRLMAGPIKRDQIPQWIPFNKDANFDAKTKEQTYAEVLASCPEIAVFGDVDVFRKSDGLAITDATQFVHEARLAADKLMRDLNQYIFSIKIEA